MNRNWMVGALALAAVVVQVPRAHADAPAGAAQVVELAAGEGRQADEHAVVMYRFSQGNHSMVWSRNLAVPRDDPDPSVSRSISQALPGMKVGGKRRVTTPPIAGLPTVFELELLDVAASEAGLKPRIEYMSAAEKAPTGPDPATFFKGCTVRRGDPGQSSDQIAGSCVGHAFSGDGLSVPDPCQASFSKAAGIWTIFTCNMDGRLVFSAHFRTDIGQLADVRYMGAGATAGVTRPELLGPGAEALPGAAAR